MVKRNNAESCELNEQQRTASRAQIKTGAEVLKEELLFVKHQHAKTKVHFQQHLTHMDQQLARTKEEMIAMAKQIGTMENVNKSWGDGVTKVLSLFFKCWL